MSNPNDPEDLTKLKRIVKTMGFMLVFGTIALVVAVIIKSSNSKNKDIIQENKDIAKQECNYSNINVNLKGDVIDSFTKNNQLTITTKQEVVIVNLCNGKFFKVK